MVSKKLTIKQERFVQEYIKDGNASQASIRAGYSSAAAKEIGSRLLTYANVYEAIKEANKMRSERTNITNDYVLTNLKDIVERCMQNEPVLDKDGNETGVYKFNANGANKSLELLGKHLQMFTDKMEVNVKTHEEELKRLAELYDDD